MNFLDKLYEPRDSEIGLVGHDNWVFAGQWFEHGKEELVAIFDADEDGDGQTVEIYCIACPARFYHVKALAGRNSIGDMQPAFTLITGSGCLEWAVKTAKLIAEGMIGIDP